MPLLYGEGERAFIRLQEEIVRSSDDQSLFAWTSPDKNEELRGLFARSPDEFAGSSDIFPFRDWKTSLPYSITNKGLSIQVPLFARFVEDEMEYYAALECQRSGNYDGPVRILLRRVAEGSDQFVRAYPGILEDFHANTDLRSATLQTIYIRQDPIVPQKWAGKQGLFYFPHKSAARFTVRGTHGSWSEEDRVLMADPRDGIAAFTITILKPGTILAIGAGNCVLILQDSGGRLSWTLRRWDHSGADSVAWWPIARSIWEHGSRKSAVALDSHTVTAVVTRGTVWGQNMYIVDFNVNPVPSQPTTVEPGQSAERVRSEQTRHPETPTSPVRTESVESAKALPDRTQATGYANAPWMQEEG